MERLALHGDILTEILVSSGTLGKVGLGEEATFLSVDEVSALVALWVLVSSLKVGIILRFGDLLFAPVAVPWVVGWAGHWKISVLSIWVLSNTVELDG